MDCPICMDCIVGPTNKVVTECGHCFHTSCLMASVAHNGFGCPYCRAVMAQEPEPDDESYAYLGQGHTQDDDDDETQEQNQISDESLQGLRRLFRQVESDINEEQEPDDSETNSNQTPIPSLTFMAEKLISQGVNYEQLLKVVLLEHDEYAFTAAYDEASDNLYEKIQTIIRDFRPEQELRDNGFLHRIAENANMMYETLPNGEMPCFQNMSTHVLKTICRQNGVRTDLEKNQMLRIIENLWTNFNDQNIHDTNIHDTNIHD